jgi:hypothetical protein
MNPLRRKFLGGAGLIGGLVAGIGAAKLTVEVVEKKKQSEDISHLAPSSHTNIMITADNGVKQKVKPAGMTPDGKLFYLAQSSPPMDELNKVTLSVGHDDRLWMKIGETWHRVAIES